MHYYRRLLAAHVCFIVSSAVLFGEDSHGRRRVQLPLNGSAIGRSFEGAVHAVHFSNQERICE